MHDRVVVELASHRAASLSLNRTLTSILPNRLQIQVRSPLAPTDTPPLPLTAPPYAPKPRHIQTPIPSSTTPTVTIIALVAFTCLCSFGGEFQSLDSLEFELGFGLFFFFRCILDGVERGDGRTPGSCRSGCAWYAGGEAGAGGVVMQHLSGMRLVVFLWAKHGRVRA